MHNTRIRGGGHLGGARIVLAGATALVACSSGSDSLTSQTQEPMVNGTLDLGNVYTHVANLYGCTGTLVTNKHVLTANHCFTSTSVLQDKDVSFYHGPTDPSDQFDFKHTRASTGPIRTRNVPGSWASERDLAIVPLDTVVATAIALPQRIAGFRGEPACAPNFSGVTVGYGPSNNVIAWRAFATNGPFVFHDYGPGEAYWNYTQAGGHITVPGDSGGPTFLNTAQSRICAISSTNDAPTNPPTSMNVVAVQSANNVAWLKSVLTQNGKFLNGACGPDDFAGPDGDRDGIPDVCDNCPLNINTEQNDADGDGYGDVCDNCPSTYNPDQGNSNKEDEDALPSPVLGDRCDPNPLTLVSATQGGSSVVGSTMQRSYTRLIAGQSGCGFPPSAPKDAATGNIFETASFRGQPGTAPTALSGAVWA